MEVAVVQKSFVDSDGSIAVGGVKTMSGTG